MKVQVIKKTLGFFGIAANVIGAVLIIVNEYQPIPSRIKVPVIGGMSAFSTLLFGYFVYKNQKKKVKQEEKQKAKNENLEDVIRETSITVHEIKHELSKNSRNSQDVSPRSQHANELEPLSLNSRPLPQTPYTPHQSFPQTNTLHTLVVANRGARALSAAPTNRGRSHSPAADRTTHREKKRSQSVSPHHRKAHTPPQRNFDVADPGLFSNPPRSHDWVLPVLPETPILQPAASPPSKSA